MVLGRQSRMPQIGDMLVVTCRETRFGPTCECHNKSEKHVGIVIDIRLDDWGHQRNVLIKWSGYPPGQYNEKHGYCGTNIHNCRNEFDMIRNGVNIP